ncbi:MAG: amidohydrolase family protein [Gammaproteobacteria bacterium]|nr:amidohydrolase family protein [Gammaproteobacteria bacterium]
MRFFKALLISLVVLSTSLSAAAESYLIKNATVYTSTAKGKVTNTDVLVENGKIVRVEQNINATGDVVELDATGKFITPGLSNPSTNMGLVEIGAVSSTVDAATIEHNMGAGFNVSTAINFRSTILPQNRINGLTRAVVLPRSGDSIFAGQGSVIALHSSAKGLLNDNVAQFALYGSDGARKAGGSRAAAMQLLEQAINEAKYVRANPSRFYEGGNWQFSQSLNDLKALYPVLDRKVPLIIAADRMDDILRIVNLGKKHNIRIVIAGGGEAWLVAKELAAAKVPVIIDPINNIPEFDSLSVKFEGAGILYDAGVKVLLTGGGTHNAYLVRQSAGVAVAFGMPKTAAIEAMTINNADVFGIKNYGQIKAGMDADIVVWDGDPLELTSNPDLVLIQGEKQPLVSRATRLRDRYWDLIGNQKQGFVK